MTYGSIRGLTPAWFPDSQIISIVVYSSGRLITRHIKCFYLRQDKWYILRLSPKHFLLMNRDSKGSNVTTLWLTGRNFNRLTKAGNWHVNDFCFGSTQKVGGKFAQSCHKNSPKFCLRNLKTRFSTIIILYLKTDTSEWGSVIFRELQANKALADREQPNGTENGSRLFIPVWWEFHFSLYYPCTNTAWFWLPSHNSRCSKMKQSKRNGGTLNTKWLIREKHRKANVEFMNSINCSIELHCLSSTAVSLTSVRQSSRIRTGQRVNFLWVKLVFRVIV